VAATAAATISAASTAHTSAAVGPGNGSIRPMSSGW
jgi:hypothetical protein